MFLIIIGRCSYEQIKKHFPTGYPVLCATGNIQYGIYDNENMINRIGEILYEHWDKAKPDSAFNGKPTVKNYKVIYNKNY